MFLSGSPMNIPLFFLPVSLSLFFTSLSPSLSLFYQSLSLSFNRFTSAANKKRWKSSVQEPRLHDRSFVPNPSWINPSESWADFNPVNKLKQTPTLKVPPSIRASFSSGWSLLSMRVRASLSCTRIFPFRFFLDLCSFFFFASRQLF